MQSYCYPRRCKVAGRRGNKIGCVRLALGQATGGLKNQRLTTATRCVATLWLLGLGPLSCGRGVGRKDIVPRRIGPSAHLLASLANVV